MGPLQSLVLSCTPWFESKEGAPGSQGIFINIFLCSMSRWPEHNILSIFCSGLGLQLSQLRISCPADPVTHGMALGLAAPIPIHPCSPNHQASLRAEIPTHTHCGTLIFHGLDKTGSALICIQPGAIGIPMGTLKKVIPGRNSVCGCWNLVTL